MASRPHHGRDDDRDCQENKFQGIDDDHGSEGGVFSALGQSRPRIMGVMELLPPFPSYHRHDGLSGYSSL